MPDRDGKMTVTEQVQLQLASAQTDAMDRIYDQEVEEEEDDEVD